MDEIFLSSSIKLLKPLREIEHLLLTIMAPIPFGKNYLHFIKNQYMNRPDHQLPIKHLGLRHYQDTHQGHVGSYCKQKSL